MKDSAIAIIGMAGRFPGARNVPEFWRNLKNGVEGVRPFTDAELQASGVSADELAQPDYVKSGVVLKDLDKFDAAFFGFSPKDASIMDPQHRIFLECAWEALEDAGHVPENFEGSIGVFAGSGMNSYLIHNLLTNARLVASAGLFLLRQTGNDKDVLATRVSYELNLRGPSINVQTACSTSLVAVHLACQSLLSQECDMALAGGVTIEFPHGRGYLYREGEILSRDGHCRSFDADSSGTVFASGAGIVVLRRLDDALAERDTIYAVILGSAINNDGARKVGYLAPSVDGQSEVIAEALGVAGVAARDISYVETHGTGTKVGDPIEIKALTQAFRQSTATRGYCAIGSLKTNIGHLDAAAGVAGLIKTVMALRHRQIPPSLHFRRPNPLIDFENSPFYVNTGLMEWNAERGKRRAGVTSLGIGGTNAHVVLEEAPPVEKNPTATKPYQLLVISAQSASALENASQNLSAHLQEHSEVSLQDVAFTLQSGRKAFVQRRTVVAATAQEAVKLLGKPEPGRVSTGQAAAAGIVFMFSGQGSQYANMGRELYETEAEFRVHLDHCAELLIPDLGLDLRGLLYPPEQGFAAAAETLSNTAFTQPALFSIEYALSQWWTAHGIAPSAMIGHSIGEYVAACVAGVFSLEDGLHLSAVRGRLMAGMPPGSMLSVAADAGALALPLDLEIAAVNGPEQCVVSGPIDAIHEFALELEKRAVSCRLLLTSHAFHSAMMDPMLESFRAHVAKVPLHAPKIPYISNVTGTWITAAEVTDQGYWTKHLRNTVRFSAGLAELFCDPARIFLEVGPGQALTSLTRQHPGKPKSSKVLSSLRHPQEQVSDAAFLLRTVGQLWIAGLSIDWNALHAGETPCRVSLPTYPFERQRYWIEPGGEVLAGTRAATGPAAAGGQSEQWFHRRVWKKSPVETTTSSAHERWLLFIDETGLGSEVSKQLKAADHEVLEVVGGDEYKRMRSGSYAICPGVRDHYDQLLRDIVKHEHLPSRILHMWPVTDANARRSLDETLDLSFYSLLFLAQAWGDQDLGVVEITCVSNGLQSVAGENVFEPARAALLGPVRVIPKEFPGVFCRNIDLDWSMQDRSRAARDVIAECCLRSADVCVAYRQPDRWVEAFAPTSLPARSAGTRLREKGVYVIVGGLGGIGLAVAEHLARTVRARLVLVGRTPLPPASEWEALLLTQGGEGRVGFNTLAPLGERVARRGVFISRGEAGEGVPSIVKSNAGRNPSGTGSALQKIAKLREIESLGAEVLTLTADVTDPTQVAEALRVARQHFGEIHGVIHAAGLIDDGPLQTKTRESAACVLAPKIHGTLALQLALDGSELDFLLLFSSISSLQPPPGQIDYAAANAFLDAFALSPTGQPVISVNWGLWADVGMARQDLAGSHGILTRRLVQTADETMYSSRLSCERDWLLGEHRFKSGVALVPGTGYLQLAAAALIGDKFELGVDFEDVFFLAPLTVAPDEKKELRVRLRRQESRFRFSILAKDKEWTEYAAGQVSRNQRHIPADQNLAEIRQRCSSRRIVFNEQYRTRQEGYFDFGPRWKNLQCLHLGEREALAELQLGQQFSMDVEKWSIHPALLDLATGSALYLLEGYEDSAALYLPLSYRGITFYRPLPTWFYSHIRSRSENTTQREVVAFNLTLLDADGHVLAEIDEFALRRMATSFDASAPAPRPRDIATYSEPAEVVEYQGMTTADGIRAFDRILSSEMPTGTIVIRGGLLDNPARPLTTASPLKSAAKPDGEIESVLAGWWQEQLGVEKVGLDDDFFDLGGHSLIAVRMFSKIKKSYHQDLSLSALFEARTIRQLAALIRAASSSNVSEVATSAQASTMRQLSGANPNSKKPVATQAKPWSALVPIQPNGFRTPLFCVHALGPSLLFYRQLAAYLGPNQPFYALQSPLEPRQQVGEISIEALASIYIKELKSLLPEGPFVLGGASLGGFIALEICQQLKARGEKPGLLILFDAAIPGCDDRVAAKEQLFWHWKNLRNQGPLYLLRRLVSKSEYWGFRFRRHAQAAACACYQLLGRNLPASLHYFQVEEAHKRALERYVVKFYPGKITLMRAADVEETVGVRRSPTLGWEPFAGGGLEIHDVPGGHISMFEEPNVRVLAGTLKTILPSPGSKPENETAA